MTEQDVTFVVYPTVIVDSGTLEVVTAGEGEDEALVVFRGPEDARRFQEHTGRHAPADGYKLIGMTHEAVASLLKRYGLRYVAMPEPWTGEGRVDVFKAGTFIAMLEESLAD